jgi:hypothetical protein
MSHILRQVEKMPINTPIICITAKTTWLQTPILCAFSATIWAVYYVAKNHAYMAVFCCKNPNINGLILQIV